MAYRFRSGSNGEMILQVSFMPAGFDPVTGNSAPIDFRDAKVEDVPIGKVFPSSDNAVSGRTLLDACGPFSFR